MSREEATEDPYHVEDMFAEMQVAFKEGLDLCLGLLRDFEDSGNGSNASCSADASSGDTGSRQAKLPKVDLPTFSGKQEEWEGFRDLFVSLVHDASGVDPATKMQYLKSCLRGPAADLVRDVASTSANYASTWQAVINRYHNPHFSVYHHLSSLMNIAPVKRESTSELRSFTDRAGGIVRALTNLKLPTDHWDIWLVFHLSGRVDPETRRLWEAELSGRDRRRLLRSGVWADEEDPLLRFPKFAEFIEFLEDRAQMLRMLDIEPGSRRGVPASSHPSASSRRVFHVSARDQVKENKGKCPVCSESHPLASCSEFRKKNPIERRTLIRHLRRCYHCLDSHFLRDCKRTGRCRNCRGRHHPLLPHFESSRDIRSVSASSTSTSSTSAPVSSSPLSSLLPPVVPSVPSGSETAPKNGPALNVNTVAVSSLCEMIVMPTAYILIRSPSGAVTKVRAFLDQGSQGSFVSESVAQLLGLSKREIDRPISISGLGGHSIGKSESYVCLHLLSPMDPEFTNCVRMLVIPRITSLLPEKRLIELNPEIFDGLSLADPHFDQPMKVDVMLGGNVYGQLLRPGVRHYPSSRLTAQNTVFGWIVSGHPNGEEPWRVDFIGESSLMSMHAMASPDLELALQRFWNVEEVPMSKQSLSPEEEICEQLFLESHSRTVEGRFVVCLPVKAKLPEIASETRNMALSSLSHMYRRFDRDANLAFSYRSFMAMYESLGHMSRVDKNEIKNPKAWYLPHHAVGQVGQKGTKIRVVFDASRRTRQRVCLNDFLMTGPALQRDLTMILTQWRQYRFVFTSDIIKIFRQIEVNHSDRDLQRILWAPNAGDEPVDYELNTVTYGTNCAPYLAIRTLLEIANNNRDLLPLGSKCLETHTYVDDIFAGADNIPQAIRIRDELIAILSSAGVYLDKWATNHFDLLPFPIESNNNDCAKLISENEMVKTLGIHWDPARDRFGFRVNGNDEPDRPVTKRLILSELAQLFDPLGWVSPIIIVAKIIMQDLWIARCDWDVEIPSEISERWENYCRSLQNITDLSIPRWLGSSPDSALEIHGFSDASSRAFAAVVYVRHHLRENVYRVALLASKTKVAPVKVISIPNLELCGATLLVRLVCQLRALEFLKESKVYLWTDSQIVLQWINNHPSRWKTFVANRVSQIQTELPGATWSHVSTSENPADIATRGVSPESLKHMRLWWEGPQWLSSELPCEPPAKTIVTQHVRMEASEPHPLTIFSTLTRLIHAVARALRLPMVIRQRRLGKSLEFSNLSVSELEVAKIRVIRLAQDYAYRAEIDALRKGLPLAKRHPLCKLNPFVSESDGLLRVGGRLSNAPLYENQKHPVILPKGFALSKLFVRYAHKATLHGGITLTTSFACQLAWIIGCRTIAKSVIQKCVVCQRVKPQTAYQLMGDLPADRVTPSRPFTVTGLDYAGPFQLRSNSGRGIRSFKGYIALFICFATKAIHLEAVGDLTTEKFLAALRRFLSRRGKCKKLYSDNASTFKGADAELRAMFSAASNFYQEVSNVLATDGVTWNFIPPATPHYGGLWEAGIKSTKHHLKRAMGEHVLTFEEFSTILCEIEACLNSRPISPLTSDVEDLNCLTPFLLLTGSASALISDEKPPNIPENRLCRHQLMERIRNYFWARWSKEYMQQMQCRSKWRDSKVNLAIGQMVLLMDERYPPTKWPLGRVTDVFPGSDGRVRVVQVKTATNTLRRHIRRLCPLYLDSDA